MSTYFKYILQLILSPTNGWDDLAREEIDADRLTSRGFYPLLFVVALSEFTALFYHGGTSLWRVVIAAADLAGSYFAAYCITRIAMGVYLDKLTDDHTDWPRAQALTVCTLGVMLFFQLIINLLPWNLVLLKFLPLYVVLILSRANDYMAITRQNDERFLCFSSLTLVVAPLLIYYMIYLLI